MNSMTLAIFTKLVRKQNQSTMLSLVVVSSIMMMMMMMMLVFLLKLDMISSVR